jgi:hypothetical protein
MPLGIPNVFSAGSKILSAAVNANFAAIASYVNGLNIPTTPVTIANGGTAATTPAAALKNLGLATGTIIPCSAAFSGATPNAITLTASAASAAVAAYSEGVTYVFAVPAGETGPFTIQDVTTSGSGLTAIPLYDTPGTTQTATMVANQLCMVVYSPALGGSFVLINPPAAASAARFAVFTATGTFTAPFTGQYFANACGAGGGGGGCNSASGGFAGGGGGGGGAAVENYVLNLTQGQTYSISIGASGAGGAAATGGGTGGTTLIETSGFSILLQLAGGVGGNPGINTSLATGGAAGGSGGLPGQSGFYFSGPPNLASGAGGGCLLGPGGAGSTSGGGVVLNGQQPGMYGGGGGGGAGNNATGGAGGPGIFRLRW